MKIHQIIYTMQAFMENRTSFSNTLQVLISNTSWSDIQFAVYLEVDTKDFQDWVNGMNFPSMEDKKFYIQRIATLMGIDIFQMAETLKKLELHKRDPNNNTFVDAMQTLDFTVLDKGLVGKVMFGPHVPKEQTGTLISKFKKRRGLPKKGRQVDFTEGAMQAIEVQILRPFENTPKADEENEQQKPEVL